MKRFIYFILAVVAILVLFFFFGSLLSPKPPASQADVPANILDEYQKHLGGYRPPDIRFCTKPFGAYYSLWYPFGINGGIIRYDLDGTALSGEAITDTPMPHPFLWAWEKMLAEAGYICREVK